MAIQLPAYLRPANAGFLSKLTGGLGTTQPPSISRRNNRFTLLGADGQPHGGIPASLTVDVVVVGGNEHPSKVYYDGAYNPDEASAPDCFSDNGVGPSSQATKPQSDLCATCPQNVWGSAISNISGKKVQACSTHKKVAVIVMGDQTGTVYLLQIPPASLKPWVGYMNHLGGQGMSPDQVITRLAFDDKAMGILTFAAVDFIPENYAAPVQAIVDSGEANKVVGAGDTPRQAALPAPTREVRQISANPENRQPPEETVFAAPPAAPRPFAGGAAAEPEAPRRVRRTKEQIAADAAAAAAQKPAPFFPETVVGAGPAAVQQAFGAASTTTSFIGGGAPPAQSFGIAQNAPPSDNAMDNLLAQAFALPTR